MRVFLLSIAAAGLVACSSGENSSSAPPLGPTEPAAYILSAVQESNRPEADMQRDAGRHPAEILTLAGVEQGWRIADLGAGGGYYSRILSSAVGMDGEIISENMDWIAERFPNAVASTEAIAAERDNVSSIITSVPTILNDFDNELDAAFMVLIYHDQATSPGGTLVATAEDRLAMNRSIYNALRPGGVYLVIDHSTLEGAGLSEVDTLHRIEESVVQAEIEAAGFVLETRSDLLANPDDPRNISVFDPSIRGNTDRFVHLYRKPL